MYFGNIYFPPRWINLLAYRNFARLLLIFSLSLNKTHQEYSAIPLLTWHNEGNIDVYQSTDIKKNIGLHAR